MTAMLRHSPRDLCSLNVNKNHKNCRKMSLNLLFQGTINFSFGYFRSVCISISVTVKFQIPFLCDFKFCFCQISHTNKVVVLGLTCKCLLKRSLRCSKRLLIASRVIVESERNHNYIQWWVINWEKWLQSLGIPSLRWCACEQPF